MADEVLTLAGTSALSDEEVVERVLTGDTALYEVVMRRYNTRLYRVARAILKNDGEAEDVMQDACKGVPVPRAVRRSLEVLDLAHPYRGT